MKKVYVDTGRTTSKKEYESFSVESSFVQLYVDINEIFAKIDTATGLRLLIWIASHMDQYNQISLNKSNRSEFISEMKGKAYSDGTVKNAIRDLRIANAIVSMSDPEKREAKYMVNPNYFWKTKNQKDRIDAIRGYRYQLKLRENEAN